MTAAEYANLAHTYRAQGRDADAEAVEIMAQEAARLARYYASGPIDDTEAEPDPQPTILVPRQAATPSGTAWMLPGIEPAPETHTTATQYRLL